VLSVNCLEFVGDAPRSIAELHRVAAPGARLVLAVLHRRGSWEWARRTLQPLRSWPYYRGRFFTEEEIASRLREADWRVDEIQRAVRFPPLRLPSERWYRWIEPLVPRSRAAVLLVRATRRAR
jgi:SAM-dependent methyltransferase